MTYDDEDVVQQKIYEAISEEDLEKKSGIK